MLRPAASDSALQHERHPAQGRRPMGPSVGRSFWVSCRKRQAQAAWPRPASRGDDVTLSQDAHSGPATRESRQSPNRHPFSFWPSRCPPTRNTRTGWQARLASDDPWTAEPLLARLGWLTFPLWLSQDPALDATPGECPRIMIDAPRICQDLSCSRMGLPPLGISLSPAPPPINTTNLFFLSSCRMS